MKLRTHDPGHIGHIAFAAGHVNAAVVETVTALDRNAAGRLVADSS